MKRSIWRFLAVILVILSSAASLHAETGKALPKGMTPEKLEKSVNRQLKYIDDRLLSGKSARQIEESGNASAIAILQNSRKERDRIAEQIRQGKLEASYWALQDLGKSLRTAMKMVRAKDIAAKKIKDDMESARIASDAYYNRAKQRKIDKGDGGPEALEFFQRAQKARNEANRLVIAKDYKSAMAVFLDSSRLLQKAIALSKKKRSGSRPKQADNRAAPVTEKKSTPKEKKSLPKGMTPKKLKKSVARQFKYISTRLLAGKSAKKIEQSGNKKAIAILERGRKTIKSIAAQIERGQHEAAYWAMQDLAASLKEAMALSRAKERAAKTIADELETAIAVSDAYLERARQRGIDKGNGGLNALDLYRRAEKERADGKEMKAQGNLKCASKAYQLSSAFLMRSISAARKWRADNKAATK